MALSEAQRRALHNISDCPNKSGKFHAHGGVKPATIASLYNRGLKIRVSVVRFRPWAPSNPMKTLDIPVSEIWENPERFAHIRRTKPGTARSALFQKVKADE